jgi:hypothetical protein
MAVYLIHFSQPYRHAGHYLGYVDTSRHPLEEALESRLAFHRAGRGSRLLRAVGAAGIDWEVVRVWEQASRSDERRLKGRSSTMLCPVCNEGWQARGRLSKVIPLAQAGASEGLESRGAFAQREADHGSALLAQRRAG